MQILMLYGNHSRGISDYVASVIDGVLDGQVDAVQLPKLNVHDQRPGRQILQEIVCDGDHDVIHIQYDNHMFETNGCQFEQFRDSDFLVYPLVQ